MEENDKKIGELLEQDMSYGEIADLLKIDVIAVINYDNERKGIIERTEKTDESLAIPTNRKRKIKKMFLEDGLSPDEIASNLKIDKKQVKEDLIMMGIDPDLPPDLRRQLIERKQERKNAELKSEKPIGSNADGIIATRLKIANLLFVKGVPEDKIYDIFSDISPDVIDWHIKYVRNHKISGYEGIDIALPSESTPPERKQNSVFGTRPDIIEGREKVDEAERYGIAESTIEDTIKYLIKTGQIEDNIPKEVIRRRLSIPELRKKFYVSEIAEMYGVSIRTINDDIRWLKERGFLDTDLRGRRSRKKVEEIEARRKRVASLYNKGKGKDSKEIASILGISKSTARKGY